MEVGDGLLDISSKGICIGTLNKRLLIQSGLCVCLCFVVYYFVSFLILQSASSRKRELVALLYCFTDVLLLLMFCYSSSRCLGLVCGVRLWYFLIIITYFIIQCRIAMWKHNTMLRCGCNSKIFYCISRILLSVLRRWFCHFCVVVTDGSFLCY